MFPRRIGATRNLSEPSSTRHCHQPRQTNDSLAACPAPPPPASPAHCKATLFRAVLGASPTRVLLKCPQVMMDSGDSLGGPMNIPGAAVLPTQCQLSRGFSSIVWLPWARHARPPPAESSVCF